MRRCFLAMVVFWLGAVGVSRAAGSGHLSSGDMIEFSLRSLKDSCRRIFEENKRLSSEIEVYRKNIHYLQRDLESLEEKKKIILKAKKSVEDVREKEVEDVSLQPDSVRAAMLLKKDIVRLRKEINSLSEKSLKKAFDAQKSSLEKQYARSSNPVSRPSGRAEQANLRQKFAVLKKENARLNKELASLEADSRR